MNILKGTSRRTWLTDAAIKTLKAVSQKTNLGQTELLSQIINAGLISIAENGNTFLLPLSFKIVT